MPDATEVQVGERSVRISSPDKVYFADLGLSKLDVVEYFLSVGDGILAALRDRPTAMERWPGGVREDVVIATRQDHRGEAFYQKRAPANTPEATIAGAKRAPSSLVQLTSIKGASVR